MPDSLRGHLFETDSRKTRRKRDVRVLYCTHCGWTTQVPMRSMRPLPELLPKSMPTCPSLGWAVTIEETTRFVRARLLSVLVAYTQKPVLSLWERLSSENQDER